VTATPPTALPTELAVEGPRPLRGRLRVPGDKSISHRALIFAAMAEGASRITGLADGDDVRRTRRVLEALGVKIRTAKDGSVTVVGSGAGGLREPEDVLDCGNSGTTLRVMCGVLAGRPMHAVLTGDSSLVRRPMGRVADPLWAMGAAIDGRDGGSRAPLSVRGGELRGGRHELPVASAQVKSALVLAGLQAEGVTEIVEPGPSRDHTERMLAAFGAPVVRVGDGVRVEAGAPSPFELVVPGDPSSAAFFVVAAAITPDSDIVLEDIALNPGRIAFIDVLLRMGADIEVRTTGERAGEPVGELHVRARGLAGTIVAGDETTAVIDEIPALAIAAAFADGITEFNDAGELRIKESDRIGTMEQELTQLGVGVESRADALVVRGGRPEAALFKSHGDHRVAMATAVAANAVEGASTVRGWHAVASSYPGFASDLARLTGTDDA